jgi:hypothetical protein
VGRTAKRELKSSGIILAGQLDLRHRELSTANRQPMIGRTRRHLSRVTVLILMRAWVSQAVPLGDASLPAASATGAPIAAVSWQPLSGGVMIGAEVGRRASRVGDSRVPKYVD